MKKLIMLFSVISLFVLASNGSFASTGITVPPDVIDTRSELTGALNINREAQRNNISTFTGAYKDLRKQVRRSLSGTDAKSDLKMLSDTFSGAIAAQRGLLKTTNTFTGKLAIWEEMERLRDNYFSSRISEVDGSKGYTDSGALALFTERKNVFLANKALREKNIEILKGFHGDKMITRFSAQIDKFANNDKKLLKLKEGIDNLINKFQINSSNQATLDRLNAIKLLIDGQINSNTDQ